MRAVLDAALAYLARGFSVVPVRSRGKRPLLRWEHLQSRAPTPEEVEAWWQRWPDANVAIVTGAASGLIVVDVDPRHGGAESLCELERRHGALPATVEALTGDGGRHLYFAHPGSRVQNRIALAPGIDVRGDGGLVVAPPSLHASGRLYRWVRAPGEATLHALPAWLLAHDHEGPGRGHPPAHWQRLLREGVPAGERNSAIASLTGHLLAHGIAPRIALELLLCWNRQRCRPPLTDQEVTRTVASISRTHARRARAHDEGGR